MEKIKAKLDNRVLEVLAEEKDKYLQMGYTLYDMRGNKIAEPHTDKNRLAKVQEENADLTGKLQEAEQRVQELDAQIASMTEAAKAADAKIADLTGKLQEVSAYAEKRDNEIASLNKKLASATAKAAKTPTAKPAESDQK